MTGGAGFIGSHLSELLLADGWEVFVLDDVSTGSLENVAHLRERPDYHLVLDSVLSPAIVNELVNKVDVVYHLAAAVGVRLIVEQPVHTMVTNVQGTETVLDYASRFGKRVIVASSSEVYGDHREEKPLEETARRIYGPTTARRWLYADSKAMDEHLALGYHRERGLDCVIVRLFNTVGPRQSGQYGMVIPRFVERALAGEPIEIHGDGTQTRCFCHVSDTIRALKGLMDERSVSGRSSTSALRSASASPTSPSGSWRRRARTPRPSSSPTTASMGRASRTCSTAFPRPPRFTRRSAGSPGTTSTRSSPT